jgi:hypothetical protein
MPRCIPATPRLLSESPGWVSSVVAYDIEFRQLRR